MATLVTETKKGNKWLTLAIESTILLLALALLYVVRVNIYEPAIVISKSMEPTLLIGDRMLIDHRNSLSGTWRRGDIVMFDAPQSWGGEENESGHPEQLVKRIIGMPGETVDVTQDGSVYINRKPLREDYIAQRTTTSPAHAELGDAQYFMMGDNRPNSDDSRNNGPISDKDIHGRALRIFWPLGRGALSAPNYD